MSKGLEALKKFMTKYGENCNNPNPLEGCYDYVLTIKQDLEHMEQLEKENKKLKKTLEIIKKKEVNFEVFGAFETYKDYEIYYDKKFHLIENKLTKEEYDLLKEVLENE